MPGLFKGLISITCLDSIDTALADLTDNKAQLGVFEYLLPDKVKTIVQQISQADSLISLKE